MPMDNAYKNKNTRTCIACRKKCDKEQLLRITKNPNGTISIGKTDGRGAYLCYSRKCADIAVKKKAVPRMLKTSASEEIWKNV
ncbi:MAG: YlxR family protein, partial [Ruminococcus sp.]|nr:YlxR family protein [Ruminococcus sp.]